MTYEQALDFIHSRIHLGTRKGLFRMEGLMKKLGNPEKRMQFVHIAGSNGKGSTATMCESVLRCAGHKTGLFLSPFVFDFRERMQVNGQLPDKQLMADVLESMLPALAEMRAEDMECTEFETVTALALMLFERCGVDTVVFEVGIGGLLDSTNIIPPPLCAAVTAISLEHTDMLGTTIPEIAAQKCGIIKEGCRAAGYCDLLPEAEQVLRETCERLHVPLTVGDLSALEATMPAPVSAIGDRNTASACREIIRFAMPSPCCPSWSSCGRAVWICRKMWWRRVWKKPRSSAACRWCGSSPAVSLTEPTTRARWVRCALPWKPCTPVVRWWALWA